MPHHDVQCSKCGTIIENYYASPWPSSIRHCEGGELEILWRSSLSSPAAAHPLNRTIVYRDPITGEIAYPGRNDIKDNRYARRGWERVEFETAHDLEKFERDHGVLNEALWYNSGNGAD